MERDVHMPKLGMTMTYGVIVRWHKQNGESVTAGEPLCEVETDKLNSEIEADASGVLTILEPEGEELGVGVVIGKIAVAEGSEPGTTTQQNEATGTGVRATQEKVSANGISLAVQRSGSGVPLILIHGLASSMGLWASLDQSQFTGIETISYDLRGHGASERVTGAHTLAKHVADLKGLLSTLAISRAVFAGHSLGGMIALELAASNPELVAGLAVLDSAAAFPQETRNMFFELASSASFNGMAAIADKLISLSFSPHFIETNPKVVATIRKGMLASDAASIAAAARMVAKVDVQSRLASITSPTIVLVGEQDELAPPVLSQQLADGIKDAQLHIIPDSGHALPVEQPHQVSTMLADLVERARV